MKNLESRFREIERLLDGRTQQVSFLSPLTAAAWAAALRAGISVTPHIANNAKSYAETVGLLDLLAGKTPHRSPQAGSTYSPLIELTSHAEVDPSNRVINELIYGQLNDFPELAAQASNVTGELHDNVPSHAMGVGFSMAQHYGQDRILEVCVADAGRGMLANVQTVEPPLSTHSEAIQWCLGEGNTTAKPVDDWAQHVPEDALKNPYGSNVATHHTRNHHAGLGLWKLAEIVRATGGSLGIWSGDARWQLQDGREALVPAPFWRGVIVALSLPVADAVDSDRQCSSARLEDLARRLGL